MTASPGANVEYVNYGSVTTDGTRVPPVEELGTEYFTVTYKYEGTSSYQVNKMDYWCSKYNGMNCLPYKYLQLCFGTIMIQSIQAMS